MNAISTIAQPMSLGDMERLATAIAKSGLFGIRTPEQALVLMAIAQAEGRHPVEAARDYDIIGGKPAKKAEAMMRDFIQAGGKVQWHSLTDELADATFTHPQTGEVRIDWDMKRAQTAFGKKDNYAKFPRQMLRSRVVSEGVRTLWPLATSGMYVPEEQADIPAKETPHTGSTIEGEPQPDRRLSQMALAEVDADRQALNAQIPLKPTRRAGTWRSAEGEDADRAEAAERERAAAAATPRAPRKAAPKVYEADAEFTLLDEPDGRQWLKNLDVVLANAQTQQEVVDISDHASVKHVISDAGTPADVKRRVDKLLADAYGRFVEKPEAEPGDDLDEVAIAGEHNLAAG